MRAATRRGALPDGRALPRRHRGRSRGHCVRNAPRGPRRSSSISSAGVVTGSIAASASTPPSPPRISRSAARPGSPSAGDQREAVELALGQREGARAAVGVLGRDEEERLRQRVRVAVDGDLVLLHRFEQRGLGAGRGPVHLVDEDNVGEHRPGAELPLAVGRAVHRRARDIGGQQVGGALHPSETAADRRRERLGEQRLAGPGNAFDQEVAARQQGNQRQTDGSGRASDCALDSVGECTGYLPGVAGGPRRWRDRLLHAHGRLGHQLAQTDPGTLRISEHRGAT